MLAHVEPIHWEAVLLTAIPSGFAAIASVFAAKFAAHASRQATEINNAVNNTVPGEPTLRESVTNNSQKVDEAKAEIKAISDHVGATEPEVESPSPKPKGV